MKDEKGRAIVYVSRLALDHFRSWRQCVLDFSPDVNILHGANGVGKTNLVEAIEVLSTGSSHRTAHALPLIEHGKTAATIRANVDYGDTRPNRTYEATIAARGANRARIDGGSSLYLRDIVGQIPSVTFSPEDQRLIVAEPAERRNFLDQAGAQLIGGYMDTLQTYTRIARQRAALLKHMGEDAGSTSAVELNGLEIWTGQLIEAGISLTRKREQVIGRLSPALTESYQDFAGSMRKAELRYAPSFSEVFGEDDGTMAISRHFQRIYQGELARGQNLIGPHRDDMLFTLDGMPARDFASNGEIWTMALAMKIALFHAITQSQGVRPLVILDDVFAQLDEDRRDKILAFARRQDQVLITVAAVGDIPPMHDEAHVIDVGDVGNGDPQ